MSNQTLSNPGGPAARLAPTGAAAPAGFVSKEVRWANPETPGTAAWSIHYDPAVVAAVLVATTIGADLGAELAAAGWSQIDGDRPVSAPTDLKVWVRPTVMSPAATALRCIDMGRSL